MNGSNIAGGNPIRGRASNDYYAANKEVICVCGEVVKRELRAEQRARISR